MYWQIAQNLRIWLPSTMSQGRLKHAMLCHRCSQGAQKRRLKQKYCWSPKITRIGPPPIFCPPREILGWLHHCGMPHAKRKAKLLKPKIIIEKFLAGMIIHACGGSLLFMKFSKLIILYMCKQATAFYWLTKLSVDSLSVLNVGYCTMLTLLIAKFVTSLVTTDAGICDQLNVCQSSEI